VCLHTFRSFTRSPSVAALIALIGRPDAVGHSYPQAIITMAQSIISVFTQRHARITSLPILEEFKATTSVTLKPTTLALHLRSPQPRTVFYDKMTSPISRVLQSILPRRFHQLHRSTRAPELPSGIWWYGPVHVCPWWHTAFSTMALPDAV
jgi:hypothetical protein